MDTKFWAKALREAEQDLAAAKRRTELNAADAAGAVKVGAWPRGPQEGAPKSPMRSLQGLPEAAVLGGGSLGCRGGGAWACMASICATVAIQALDRTRRSKIRRANYLRLRDDPDPKGRSRRNLAR
jgi:hypothetical protein